jgi:arylsulfatase A-like enzyme
VPLVFFGAGVAAGRYDEPSTPADVAPTLAAIAGVPLPDVDGQPRTRALTHR